jgi:hypothetical protein
MSLRRWSRTGSHSSECDEQEAWRVRKYSEVSTSSKLSLAGEARPLKPQREEASVLRDAQQEDWSEGGLLTLLVPAWAAPGSKVRIRSPQGSTMLVAIPKDVAVGMPFSVQLPAVQESSGSSREYSFSVEIPPHYGPGMDLELSILGLGPMKLHIPEGVGEGDRFRFRVPRLQLQNALA